MSKKEILQAKCIHYNSKKATDLKSRIWKEYYLSEISALVADIIHYRILTEKPEQAPFCESLQEFLMHSRLL